MIRTLTLVLAVAASGLLMTACSTSGSNDAGTNAEDRRSFDERRYRDPHTGRIPENIRAKELAFTRTLPGLAEQKRGEDVQALATFNQVGPVNVGGRTRAMALDVTDPNTILAGGVSGGMWRSTDAGGSWQLVTESTTLHSITTIAQDKRQGKTNTWYYGSGEAYGNSARITGNGVWKSTDGGLTWRHLESTATDRIPATHDYAYCWRIVTDHTAEDDVLYLATARRGIHRSADGGETWTNVLASNSFWTDIAITEEGVLYAVLSDFTGISGQRATSFGVFRSENGVDWVDISPDFLPDGMSRGVIGLVPGDDRLFVVANTPGAGTKGIRILNSGTLEEWHSIWMYEYLSGDGSGDGGRWEDRSESVPLFGGRSGDMNSQGGYDLQVAVSPHDTDLVIVGAVNLYRSTNGFRSPDGNGWIGGTGLPSETERFPSYPGQHADQHEILFHPTEPNTLFSGHDGGMSVTSDVYADPVAWDSLNHAYYTTQFYAIAVRDTAGDDHVMGGLQDNGTWEGISASPLTDWVRRNGADGGYCAFADSGRSLYVSTQLGRIRRIVVDADGNEVARTRVDPGYLRANDTFYLFINPYVLDPNDDRIMYHGGGGKLWRNNDLTEIPLGTDDSTFVNWDSLETSETFVGEISAIAVSRKPAHVVYVGTTSGRCYRIDDAHEGQPDAVDVSQGIGPGYLNSITVDQRDADHVIATISSYGAISIYESFDGGASWRGISGNLEENPNGSGSGPAVNWVEILPYDDNTDVLLAATSTGLFMTSQSNGMSTVWTHIATETIGTVPIDMLVSRYSDKRVAVGTHGRGVFFGTIDELPSDIPQAPSLILPANEARGVYPDTVLVWSATPGAVSYALEFSSSPDFDADLLTVDGLRDTTYEVRGLTPGPRLYYWRVTAYSAGGAGPSSDTWSFSTMIDAPEAVYPENRATDVAGLPVEVRWTHVPTATAYDVEVSTNLAFQSIVTAQQNVQDTVAFLDGLESGTRYFWHVRAKDVDTFGLWSQRAQFTTGVLTSVQEAEAPSIGISPNPSTDRVVIATPEGNGTIEIVDLEGRRRRNVAVHSATTEVDLRGLAAGTYVVRLTIGREVREEKLVVQ